MKYKVPASADRVLAELGAVAELVNATEWKKAALVTALVGPSAGRGRPVNDGNPSFMTVTALAERKFRGLRDREQVAYYRDCWLRHFSVPKPGEVIDFESITVTWPGVPETDLAQQTGMTPERRTRLLEAGKDAGMPTGAKVVDIAANPKSMAAAIMADPATALAAWEALAAAPREVHDAIKFAHKSPESPEGKALQARISAIDDADSRVVVPVLDAAIALERVKANWEENWPGATEHGRSSTYEALGEIQVTSLYLRGLIEMEREAVE